MQLGSAVPWTHSWKKNTQFCRPPKDRKLKLLCVTMYKWWEKKEINRSVAKRALKRVYVYGSTERTVNPNQRNLSSCFVSLLELCIVTLFEVYAQRDANAFWSGCFASPICIVSSVQRQGALLWPWSRAVLHRDR